MLTSWIEEFICVARDLNISAASRQLNMSQPNLSRHLKQMEQELGFKLFVLKDRHIQLTSAGKFFADNAAIMVNHYHNLVGHCRDIAQNEKKSIRVQEPPYDDEAGLAYLSYLNNEASGDKTVRLSFISELEKRATNCLEEDICDIALVYHTKHSAEELLQDQRYHAQYLTAVPMGVWVNSDIHFALMQELTLENLSHINIIFPNNPNHPLRQPYLSLMKENGLKPNYSNIQVDSRFNFANATNRKGGFLFPASTRNQCQMYWRKDLVFVPLCREADFYAYAVSKIALPQKA